jgi:hypothetical protein
MSTVLISAGDARYFPLVQGAISSLRNAPERQGVSIAFLDLGCTDAQRAWLLQRVDYIERAHWEVSFPGRASAKEYMKGLCVRPFLQRYFPGFDVYIWIDGDAWVQDWNAIALLAEGARRRGLAIVPELDRGSRLQYGGLSDYWLFNYRQYELAFGKDVAQELHTHPVLNAGVFALHKDAPHWDAWAHQLFIAARNGANLYTDQCALNLTVYKRGLVDSTELLPAWCNWTCHIGLPAWDKSAACFVEPYLPHTRIGILHLTGPNKADRLHVRTTCGTFMDLSLRYGAAHDGGITHEAVVRTDEDGFAAAASLNCPAT